MQILFNKEITCDKKFNTKIQEFEQIRVPFYESMEIHQVSQRYRRISGPSGISIRKEPFVI